MVMQTKLIVSSLKDLENLIRQCLKDELALIADRPIKGEHNQSQILNINQAAKFLNLAKPTVYALTSKKKVPFFKTGKKLYFKRSELLEWIEAGKQKITK